jgi:DNA polymerase-1
MAEASRVLLDGFELKSDVTITRFPGRLVDEDGQAMWDRVQRILREVSGVEHV